MNLGIRESPMKSFEPFDAVVEGAVRLLDLSMARLRMVDSLRRIKVMGYAGRVVQGETWKELALGEGFAGKVVANRELVFASRVSENELVRDIPWVKEEELVSIAALPLVAGERVLGMMALGNRELREYPPEDRQLIQAFASMAAWKLLPHMHLVDEGRFQSTEG